MLPAGECNCSDLFSEGEGIGESSRFGTGEVGRDGGEEDRGELSDATLDLESEIIGSAVGAAFTAEVGDVVVRT